MSKINERGLNFLKLVMRLGGGYEIIMGLVMIFFIGAFFRLLGAPKQINYLMFPGSVGVLAICFGLLLIGAARDPQRYIIIPLVSVVLRILIQIPVIIGYFSMPEMTLPLVGFGAFDLVFAVLTLIAIKRSGIDWKNF